MKNFIKVALGIIIAFLLYSTLSKLSPSLARLFNFFTLVVIYFAIAEGEVFGACLGSFCGLVQDSFSLGVFGVSGLAKTISGFLAGYISKKVNIISVVRSFFFIFILVSIEFILWALLYMFIFSEKVNTDKGLVFFQPVGTAFFGAFLFHVLRKLDRDNSKDSR